MSSTLKDFYIEYEKNTINQFFDAIVEKIKEEGKIYFYDKNGKIKEDKFLELGSVDDLNNINLKEQGKQISDYQIPEQLIKEAIRFTIRKGSVQRATAYNTFTPKNNKLGTQLNMLINVLGHEEISEYSLVGKTLSHSAFGDVLIKEMDYEQDIVHCDVDGDDKPIVIDYWEINDKDKGVFQK